MKYSVLGLVALSIGGLTLPAVAGSSCCPTTKATQTEVTQQAETKAAASCGEACLEGIQLSEEQQAEVATLMKQCSALHCSATAAEDMKKGLQQILTADQFEVMQGNCRRNGCPYQETASG